MEGPLSPTLPNGISHINSNGHLHHDDSPSTSTSQNPVVAPTFDPNVFRTYLLSLLPPVLGATPNELEGIFADEEAFEEKVLRFAGESAGGASGSGSGGVLYVVKMRDGSSAEGSSSLRPSF